MLFHDNPGCLEGPPAKLTHGLARTKAEPTSVPTAQLTPIPPDGTSARVSSPDVQKSGV